MARYYVDVDERNQLPYTKGPFRSWAKAQWWIQDRRLRALTTSRAQANRYRIIRQDKDDNDSTWV